MGLQGGSRVSTNNLVTIIVVVIVAVVVLALLGVLPGL
jgi:hypothetical protein